MIDAHHQIGEVAAEVGLSLRTIRYYEEIGLVAPSGRTDGGFRLYTDADVERLHLVKRLKPVGLSLETIGELLECADLMAGTSSEEIGAVEDRFQSVLATARRRCDDLETCLHEARRALDSLDRLPMLGGR